MGLHHILAFLALIVVVVAIQAAALPAPEVYWNSVLPDTPMPKSVSDLLLPAGKWERVALTSARLIQPMDYRISYGASEVTLPQIQRVDPSAAVFFLEKNLELGKTMSLQFSTTTNEDQNTDATFLPRQVANSVPFSSDKLLEIYSHFSVKPGSEEAELMEATVKQCETPAFEGVEKHCATSLESMIDFTTSKLGNSLRTISTQVPEQKQQKVQDYTIVEKVGGEKTVVCHKQNYVYAVFYCHTTQMTRAFKVSLEGSDGKTKVKAVAICHPNHICHFLLNDQDHVAWVSSN